MSLSSPSRSLPPSLSRSLLTTAALLALANAAHATNGYFAHGHGAQSLGLAGVSVALPQDALVIASNPAGISQLGSRLDAGLTLFRPERSATIRGNGVPGFNGEYSGDGKKNFWIPELGYTRVIDPNLSLGLAIYGNGGMNTMYDRGIPLFGSGKAGSTITVARMMWVSFVTAMVITVGKIAISLLSAFAIVYFRFPFKGICFWLIFITLMLPVEVRIGPTYQVVSNLGMLNTYAGLTVPLIASATATFLFRQFFLTVPDELVEAARIDGAGPMRFFKDILVPLSRTSIAALFVIQFIYGWNQYLWPLLVTTSEDMYPVVIGIKRMIAGGDTGNEWNVVMATALLAMLPPALVVVFMQRWFVKGLVDTEK
mgnify:CR=1 FL=1